MENEEKNRELSHDEMSKVSGGWGEYSSSYYITDRCIACGTCEDECPIGAIYESGVYYHINDSVCIDCGNCYELCPVSAIERR